MMNPKSIYSGLALMLAPAMVSTAAGATAPFSADTPVETLAADPAARAVLEKDVPTLLSHPGYAAIKSLSLRQIKPYSGGALTDAIIATADTHLRALPVK